VDFWTLGYLRPCCHFHIVSDFSGPFLRPSNITATGERWLCRWRRVATSSERATCAWADERSDTVRRAWWPVPDR